MITTKNFKALKDGRYRLKLSDEIRNILVGALAQHLLICMHTYEYYLCEELIQAMQKEEIKLRRSEFFLLFSRNVQRMIPEGTQTYISAWIEMDEVKRQMAQKESISKVKYLYS